MKNMIIVLTESDLWAERVRDHSILYWSMESMKRLIKGSWVHFVFRESDLNVNTLQETLSFMPWVKLGDIYPVKNHLPFSYGAMAAFPSFNGTSGAYLFNAGVVVTPGLTNMGSIDWFAYTDDRGHRSVTPPDSACLPDPITPIGLYSFSNFDRFFNASKIDDGLPLEAYNRYQTPDRLVSTKLQGNEVVWVDSLEGIQEFESKVVDASLQINL